MPKILSDDKQLNRRYFDWVVSNDGIFCIKWKDKRCVSLLSCDNNAVNSTCVERKERNGEKVRCPYNQELQ